MLHAVKGTVFVIGSHVDAADERGQKLAGICCVLKATDQPVAGKGEMRYGFHTEYFNLPFQDSGACATDPGVDSFQSARSWLAGAAGIAEHKGGKVLVHSWSGLGKAIRLVAAHLAGWKAENYAAQLARVYEAAGILPAMRREAPGFEAALVAALEAPARPMRFTTGPLAERPKCPPPAEVSEPVETTPAGPAGEAAPVEKPKKRGRRPKL